jgi:hypothetical protein
VQQAADDERIELRIEELRALLPLQAVLDLPGMKQARKNPGRAAWTQYTAQAAAASATLSTPTSKTVAVAAQVRGTGA